MAGKRRAKLSDDDFRFGASPRPIHGLLPPVATLTPAEQREADERELSTIEKQIQTLRNRAHALRLQLGR